MHHQKGQFMQFIQILTHRQAVQYKIKHCLIQLPQQNHGRILSHIPPCQIQRKAGQIKDT